MVFIADGVDYKKYILGEQCDNARKINKKIEKCKKGIGINTDLISDGYHTFGQLYYQRCVLFATICNQNKNISWKSKKHADGSMYENYFIVGIKTPKGNYTYHYEMKYWELFEVKELANAPEWDGHTEEDIFERLSSIE